VSYQQGEITAEISRQTSPGLLNC